MPPHITHLFLCPGHRKPMMPVAMATAIENLGLQGDLHAIADSSRQVLLMEQEILNTLGLLPGIVKENITTSGVALMSIGPKRRLLIGNETMLEVVKPCAPCSRMDEIRPGLQKEIAGRRGVLCRVVRGGTIRPGDSITVL